MSPSRQSAAILLLAVLVDRLLGEPPSAIHPVVGIGRLVARVFRLTPGAAPAAAKLATGAASASAVLLVAGGLAWAIERATCRLPVLARVLLLAVALKPAFAWRSLEEHTRRVLDALAQGDLPGARRTLAAIVSRQTASLDEPRVAAGAIESLAENLSDSVVGPLFWYATGGLPGAWLYRAANTMDAMVGYRDERYEHLGKAAARLDDALNWAPARLTAALIVLAAWVTGADAGGGARILRRDGGQTESPNAGLPMSAMAGALGVELEKVGHYRLGEGLALPGPYDLCQALKIARAAGGLAVVLAAAGSYSRRAPFIRRGGSRGG